MRWILPCNLKYYDVFGSFEKNEIIDWKQTNPNIAIDDEVFIYVGQPVRAIVFRCKVLEVNMAKHLIDDREFSLVEEKYINHKSHMRIKLVAKYDPALFNYQRIAELGEKGRIMCQRRMAPALQLAIDEYNGHDGKN